MYVSPFPSPLTTGADKKLLVPSVSIYLHYQEEDMYPKLWNFYLNTDITITIFDIIHCPTLKFNILETGFLSPSSGGTYSGEPNKKS
jgi:hypothetical protein